MCDYSLGGLPNRLAVEGEELVVHRFRTGSLGLAPPAEVVTAQAFRPIRQTWWEHVKSVFQATLRTAEVCAVCVPPGAQLMLTHVPEDTARQWNIRTEDPVVFTQTSADENRYRDALEFSNGLRILLQGMQEGTRVRVTSLGVTTEEQREQEWERLASVR